MGKGSQSHPSVKTAHEEDANGRLWARMQEVHRRFERQSSEPVPRGARGACPKMR